MAPYTNGGRTVLTRSKGAGHSKAFGSISATTLSMGRGRACHDTAFPCTAVPTLYRQRDGLATRRNILQSHRAR